MKTQEVDTDIVILDRIDRSRFRCITKILTTGETEMMLFTVQKF